MKVSGIIASAVAVAIALLAAAGPVRAANLPPDFEDHRIAEDITMPTDVAWAPDGRLFVTEIDGHVRTVAPGHTNSTELLDISNRVNTNSDRGLLGIAVDASYATNHYIYVLYTHERMRMTPDGDGPMNSQLIRVKLNASGDGVEDPATDEQVILGRGTGIDGTDACPPPANNSDCIPSEGNSHSIGSVRAAPDGTLFVGSGDAADYSGVDPTALRTYDERSMAGKIMHIDRNGRGLTGHPFCATDSDLDDVCTKLYAMGFRNPFRFHVRPNGKELVVGDVGWNEREEIDLIGAGGRNYGWPCYEGVQHTPGYRELDQCQPEYQKEDSPASNDLLPDYDYPHWGPPDQITGSTVLGGQEYEGLDYPAPYKGRIFVGDYATTKIMTLDQEGPGAPSVDLFADDVGPIVDLDTAPDGNVVYVTFGDWSPGGGEVREITYSASNHSPVAGLTSDTTSGAAPLTVHFDGSSSHDAEDGTSDLEFDWDFGDGSAHSSQESPSHTYAHAGRYTAHLAVTDTGGKHGTATLVVQVGEAPTITSIEAPDSYRDGEPLDFHAEASDDHPIPADGYSWQLILRHNAHFHPLDSGTGPDAEVAPPDDHDADAYVNATLTVTDSDGLQATKTIQVHPRTATVRILSTPPGAPMEYAGLSHTAPFEAPSAIGFKTSVSVDQRFFRNGRDYLFDGWGDSGPRLRSVTVPDEGLTLTARYRDVTPTIVKPPPNTALSGPALAAPDHSGPRLRFKKLDARNGVVSGTTSDAAGVRRVYLALGRATRKKARCLWWATSIGRLSRSSRACTRPRWIRATLKGASWNAKLHRRKVPPGSYRLLLRAADRLDNVTETFRRVAVAGARVTATR